ncbi:hypothetical protein FRC11_002967 [Ceratobasidium sp. 423]|nr:hypothetical protein FRC11_002967 [Ceratobasidium sp. 423]
MSQAWTLDPDTLQLVLGHLEHEKGFLFRMSFLNKGVYSLVLPILYRFNSFISITPASKFCRALHDHPQSPARFVQKLHVHTVNNSQRLFWSKEAREFVRLIHTTLPLLLGLQDLRISGAEFETEQSLSELPFSLRSFGLLLPVAGSLGEFLKTQASLKHLELFSSRVPLGKNDCFDLRDVTDEPLLPNLNTLVACAETFSTLAPNRPIVNATVNWCRKHGCRTLMPSVISAIDQSTAWITALKVDLRSIRDTRCVDFVSSLGSTKAASTLETLTLVTTHLDNEYWMPPEGQHSGPLSPPPELFSGLGALRSLIIEKPVLVAESQVFDEESGEPLPPVEPEFDSIWSHVGAKELWQANCRALASVRIYGKRLNTRDRDS